MITIVGAGFAGVEAAWALASRGVHVRLYEMRPQRMTPAHTTSWFAELVCSNSFKSKLPTSPAGLLKGEMAALGSLVLEVAARHEVPAGEALGVDREAFGEAITRRIEEHPLIEVVREEFTPAMAQEALGHWGVGALGEDLNASLPQCPNALVFCTGPLTSPELAHWLAQCTGREHLYFYDAVSPTVEASSLDRSIIFAESRYGKGEGDDYLNCPFDRDSYEAFVEALVSAERAPIHAFEAGGVRGEVVVGSGYELGKAPPPCPPPHFPTNSVGAPLSGPEKTRRGSSDSQSPAEIGRREEAFLEQIKYFAGCTPIEAIAEKGARSLAFGNFKPVGLTDPRTGRRPWAALQLRPENKEKTLYSLVACQTRLKWGEQKRIFRMVPGMENAEFVRFGVIHRNTYLEAPRVLTPDLELRDVPGSFVAGQLTGVEGYVESAAMGIYVGLVLARRLMGQETPTPPRETAYGSLLAHLQDQTEREFAPMNINWGLLPDPPFETRDKGVRRAGKLEAAHTGFQRWLDDLTK